MSEQLSDEQSQQLMDAIIISCEEMALTPEQILDGLGRAMLSAAATFEKSNVTVSIENFGQCTVSLSSAVGEN
ncbi:hypothetical protein [Aliiglaciecola litoralis]|uniref:Uncharacterized protein n=1 Tax=Aliiglaciecola litoralis TaxID=582857 RepID=A0ABP3WNY5_9ALTE